MLVQLSKVTEINKMIKFNNQIAVALISLTYFDASSFFDYLFIHYSRKLGKMEGDS